MPAPNTILPSADKVAEETTIVLTIGPGGGNGRGLQLDTWKSYSFNSHFLTPTDGWSFTLGDEDVSDELRLAIAPRQYVTLSTQDGLVLGTGVVDKVVTKSNRSGGTELTIEGRDVLGPAVSSVIDPRMQFKESMTLLDLLEAVFKPYGWDRAHILTTGDLEDEAFLDKPVLSGGGKGAPIPVKWRGHSSSIRTTSKKGKPLKNFTLHQLKPEPHEGAFAFAARVAQRFGLWIFPSSSGKYLLVGTPDFDQAPVLQARHKRGAEGATNNIISSELTQDVTDQPSVIFASGFGAGGNNPRDMFTVCVVNPMIQTDNTALFQAYPHTRPLDLSYLGPNFSGDGKETPVYNATGLAVVDTNARPLFLHDDESKTIEELTAFLKRELALRMHKSFLYKFEVEGHEYIHPDGSRTPWDVDAMVRVDDDISNVQQDLWILSRTFTKSRSGGTTTHLECIIPHTLEF